MSSYVSFWVKNKDGAVTRLCDFSRSSFIYQAASYAGINGKYDEQPDGGILWDRDKWAEPYTKAKANEILAYLNEKIKSWKDSIEKIKEKINIVKNMANTPLNEKLEAIDEYTRSIDDYKLDLEQLEAAATQIDFLEIIRDTVSYGMSEEEKDNCLWAGIDCNMKGANDEEE